MTKIPNLIQIKTENEPFQSRPPVHPVTLTFSDRNIRETFEKYATFRSLPFVRLSLGLAIFLYFFFAFLDPLIMPAVIQEITRIRAISVTFFGLVIGITYTTWGIKNFQFLMSVVVLFASAGIIAMILISEATGGYLYYAALILAIIYAHSLLRLRVIYASLTTWVVIIVYITATRWLETTPFSIYMNNVFFLISANIMGMFASYWLEYYMKAVFWKEQMLREKTDQLETEYLRKTEELDAAREIQLRMLPHEFPQCAGYLFSFSMKPASEVGGDYYDYHIGDDGAITFGIGDATGHGMQASVMVTAIKLLFSEHAVKTELTEFLKQASRSISLMGFRKIYLAFAIGRLHNHILELCGAGMPPALIFRCKTETVEQIPLKGFPLGSRMEYPYQKTAITIDPGDTVLFMTDGFPELSDQNGEMIGYQAVADHFSGWAHLTPADLITQLNAYAETWQNGSARNDDITFFAFKRIDTEIVSEISTSPVRSY